ncbi:GT2 family glycosyltransferase [Wenyingzhuangia heitensis]|uniref:GT2 family glycosyltransferase n=1 Tax=Wenyingzhuangia heitensis TaxID=1487859 RepID=A0ABX0UAD1_9FLAO|nr:glycosyltransferase [Wenyingzhuangia heitensis]NIJ45777.1 GT2 family glycosyltransferase [Wenyingzhuangia heitensis]
MELSIIISYYKALDNLKLILSALNMQSKQGFEVVISEDDCSDVTDDFIKNEAQYYNFRILHTKQKEDNGFRKCEMLNKSVRIANADKVVFIDGDCIPHKHFVKTYVKLIESGYFYCGRRVMLGKQISDKLKESKEIEKLSFLNVLFSDSKKKKEGFYSSVLNFKKDRGILGCNWGVMKEHLLALNGFDEDYKIASVGEDTDIEWRLRNSGLKMASVKNKAIVYHIFHEECYCKNGLRLNMELMQPKKENNAIVCKNGLSKGL